MARLAVLHGVGTDRKDIIDVRMLELVRGDGQVQARPPAASGDQLADRIRAHRRADPLAEQVDQHELSRNRASLAGGPRRPSSRRGSRGSPSASRICQTVCAEPGIPSPVSAAAISVTLCLAARSSSTRCRSWPVAFAGPSAPAWPRRTAPACSCAAAWPSGQRWRGVPELVSNLAGGHVLGEVGAQRLIPAPR